MKVLWKILVLLPVCFITWWGTSALLAQQSGKPKLSKQRQAQPQPRTNVEQVTTTPGTLRERQDGHLAAAKQVAMPAMTAMHGIKHCKINVADGLVTIDAQVSLSSTMKNDLYVWRLSFYDADANVIVHKVYDTQVFGMEADGSMEPTFNDITPLVRGTKLVKLSLYNFKPGTDLAIFRDDKASQGNLILSGGQALK